MTEKAPNQHETNQNEPNEQSGTNPQTKLANRVLRYLQGIMRLAVPTHTPVDVNWNLRDKSGDAWLDAMIELLQYSDHVEAIPLHAALQQADLPSTRYLHYQLQVVNTLLYLYHCDQVLQCLNFELDAAKLNIGQTKINLRWIVENAPGDLDLISAQSFRFPESKVDLQLWITEEISRLTDLGNDVTQLAVEILALRGKDSRARQELTKLLDDRTPAARNLARYLARADANPNLEAGLNPADLGFNLSDETRLNLGVMITLRRQLVEEMGEDKWPILDRVTQDFDPAIYRQHCEKCQHILDISTYSDSLKILSRVIRSSLPMARSNETYNVRNARAGAWDGDDGDMGGD